MDNTSSALNLSPAREAASVLGIAMMVATAAYSGRGADTMALEGLLTQLKHSSLDMPLMQAAPAAHHAGPALRISSASAPVSAVLNASMVQQAVSTNRSRQLSDISMPRASTLHPPSVGPHPTPRGVHGAVTAPRVGTTSVTAPRIKEAKS